MPTIRVTVEGKTAELMSGATLLEALRALLAPSRVGNVLCALRGGVCMELSEPLTADCELTPITYRDEEGRRVYERTLRFLFLLSAKRLYPKLRIRMLNSVGHGLYIRALVKDLMHEDVEAIERDMRELVKQDVPFLKEIWSREDAIQYFQKEGWHDEAGLMRYRPNEKITMYRIGDFCEYFYGAMLPSTGYVSVFALKPHFPGVVLMWPEPDAPSVPAPYLPRTKFLRVFAESQEWCRILGAQNAVDVNRMIRKGGIRDFIRVNEALQDRSTAHIADQIAARRARVIMVFGPSSSGKTTFAHRLAIHLRALGLKPKLVSLDDFYRNLCDLPLEADGTPDREHVDSLDVPLLTNCIEGLLGGQSVQMPRFDFKTATRFAKGYAMRLGPDEPIIFEGIHAMSDKITSGIPEQLMFSVYVSALGCINLDDHNRIRTTDVRLLRRIVRDIRLRNTSVKETIDMWPKVRLGEEKWIFPNQEKADVFFNTSLHYELPVLKTIAYDLLLYKPQSEPDYLVAHRLLKTLHYFLPVDARVREEIPPMSILREFVGESPLFDAH